MEIGARVRVALVFVIHANDSYRSSAGIEITVDHGGKCVFFYFGKGMDSSSKWWGEPFLKRPVAWLHPKKKKKETPFF